jgi:hypothetical protein
VADTSSISQAIVEAAADDATTSVSQAVVEAGVDDAATNTSQAVLEAAAADATVSVSQVVIEFSLGEEIPPSPPEPITGTFAFDEGGGVEWWIVPQLTDSGVELRDKVIKAVRVTGLVTSANVKVYTYGPSDPVVVADLEDGTNSVTGAVSLPNTTNVAQSPRLPVDCKNAMLSTVRVAGTWDGTNPRNRIDEILYELARQGVRR